MTNGHVFLVNQSVFLVDDLSGVCNILVQNDDLVLEISESVYILLVATIFDFFEIYLEFFFGID